MTQLRAVILGRHVKSLIHSMINNLKLDIHFKYFCIIDVFKITLQARIEIHNKFKYAVSYICNLIFVKNTGR